MKDCAAFFVCCADLKRLEMACEKHGTEIKHEGVEDFIVATVDVTLAKLGVSRIVRKYLLYWWYS